MPENPININKEQNQPSAVGDRTAKKITKSGTIAVMPASCIVLSQRFTASIKQLRSVFCIEFSNLA